MTNGPSEPRSRASRAALSRPRIAAAAFALIDAEGVAALSARKLAQALGCEAMSLYHHLPNMDAVLDDVVDLLFAGLPLPGPGQLPDRDPRTGLLMISRAFLDLATHHPQVLLVAVSRRWTTPATFAMVQAAVRCFEAVGSAPLQALRHARVLGAYLGGAGSALAGWQRSRVMQKSTPAPEQLQALDQVAPGLRQQSTQDNVLRDLDAGLEWLIDALLQQPRTEV